MLSAFSTMQLSRCGFAQWKAQATIEVAGGTKSSLKCGAFSEVDDLRFSTDKTGQ